MERSLYEYTAMSSVSVPTRAISAGPYINWRHVDGPMLSWAGQIHWLTWRERFSLFVRWQTVDHIACRRWPYLERLRSGFKEEPGHE